MTAYTNIWNIYSNSEIKNGGKLLQRPPFGAQQILSHQTRFIRTKIEKQTLEVLNVKN